MKDNTSAFNAKEYDEKIKKTLPYYEAFYEQVIDVVKAQFTKPLNWLDIGCGTGKMAEVAFKKVALKRFVFCDPSNEMLEIAKQYFEGERSLFVNESIADLNIEDSFDVITSIQVFHYLQKEERIGALKKCYDALAPNGIMISFENFAPSSEQGKALFLKRWESYQIGQGKSEEEATKHIGRYGKGYFPIAITEHLKAYKEAGFESVEVLWVSNMQVGLLGIK